MWLGEPDAGVLSCAGKAACTRHLVAENCDPHGSKQRHLPTQPAAGPWEPPWEPWEGKQDHSSCQPRSGHMHDNHPNR